MTERSDAEKNLLDGLPAPKCPIKCGIDGHRMTLTDREGYLAVMGDDDE